MDVNDKQMDQWNVNAPLLYLWSRSDWTARHKAIAEEHGHFSDLSQDMLASPPCSPLPSVEEQKEAEDIISQVVGDISVINNEVMEVRQEDVSFRKGKGKVDPGPRELESQVKTGPSVMKDKEGKDVGGVTAANEGVKKGSLERMGSHREVRGIDRQNEGRGGRADQNSGTSSPLKEPRANRGNLQMENNNGRFDSSLNRGIGTIQRENSSSLNEPRANRENLQTENNNGRYNSSSNKGIGTIQKENHNTAGGEILPMAGSQYNDPLIEQPIEMRQLDCQLDFSDLGSILGNGNDDFNDMTRQYPTPSSYDWPVASGLGSGSGSILEYNRGRGSDYMDHRGFDDFEGLGRLYGSHDVNRHNNFGAVPISHPGSTFHNGTSAMDRYTPRLDETNCWRPVGSLGFSGLGSSTSTSAMDRYTPRLDETNILRPGVSLGFSGGSHQFHQGVGGYGGSSGLPPYPYDMHGVDRRDMPAPHPNLSGFGPRQLPSFQPPPGSSGGWLDD